MPQKEAVIISEAEKKKLRKLFAANRGKHFPKTKEIVQKTFDNNPQLKELLKEMRASEVIETARQLVWNQSLYAESVFNPIVMRDLPAKFENIATIMNASIEKSISQEKEEALRMKEACIDFAGEAFSYFYELALSNTQSRRSRAGEVFQEIIYQIYRLLDYPYASQGGLGKEIFEQVGLTQKVDSVLPSLEYFKVEGNRRKAIVGTMKTSLRERWTQAAEELSRANIPSIYLLTVDEKISEGTAKTASKHNIVIVTLKRIIEKKKLSGYRNIISFEDYFFEEIPDVKKHWGNISSGSN